MRLEDRQRIEREVPARVIAGHRSAGAEEARRVLLDTLYHERRRLERAGRRASADELTHYRALQRELERADEAGRWRLVERAAAHFAAQVVGASSELAYTVATRVAPVALAVLLNLRQPQRLLGRARVLDGLSHQLTLEGETDLLCRLAARGAKLVVVPTHSSNLDPMIMAYALSLLGQERFLFGGSAHLFKNPIVSFFLHTLGAYRVDRTRQAALYKEVLKEYATLTLEMGYHHIFFPGGTRSRDGSVETHLKRGLLGTALRAFVNQLRAGAPRPLVVVVPCAISYKLVLEAETLIDDHLQEVGKSRYIIDDDEFTRPTRVLSYLSRLVASGGTIVVRVGAPLDVIGNRVDGEGQSRDPRGRPIDPAGYVSRDGAPTDDAGRDVELTNELAETIAESYRQNATVMSTHVVAHALLRLLRRANPALGLYRLLRTGGDFESFPLAEVHAETERVRQTLTAIAGRGPRAGRDLDDRPEAIVADALAHYALYHRRPAALRRGDRVFHDNRNLLLFYSNRVAPWPRRGAVV